MQHGRDRVLTPPMLELALQFTHDPLDPSLPSSLLKAIGDSHVDVFPILTSP
jgi:hypothetical protein